MKGAKDKAQKAQLYVTSLWWKSLRRGYKDVLREGIDAILSVCLPLHNITLIPVQMAA